MSSSHQSLNDKIARDQLECLNEDAEYPAKNLLIGDGTLFCSSDIDPQMIISIPFEQSVKLSSLRFIWRTGGDVDARPNVIKLFTNRVSIGFSDAESLVPVQTITMDEIGGESDEVTVPLKFVLFQNVVSLQIFVESNRSEEGSVDKTEIGGIEVFGSTGETFDMKAFKKMSDE